MDGFYSAAYIIYISARIMIQFNLIPVQDNSRPCAIAVGIALSSAPIRITDDIADVSYKMKTT